MPQLAPLSWAFAPILFWVLLLTLSASFWWSNTPQFPEFSSVSHSKFSSWKW